MRELILQIVGAAGCGGMALDAIQRTRAAIADGDRGEAFLWAIVAIAWLYAAVQVWIAIGAATP